MATDTIKHVLNAGRLATEIASLDCFDKRRDQDDVIILSSDGTLLSQDKLILFDNRVKIPAIRHKSDPRVPKMQCIGAAFSSARLVKVSHNLTSRHDLTQPVVITGRPGQYVDIPQVL